MCFTPVLAFKYLLIMAAGPLIPNQNRIVFHMFLSFAYVSSTQWKIIVDTNVAAWNYSQFEFVFSCSSFYTLQIVG